MLIAAMNPCPCGFLGDAVHPCTCGLSHIQQYRGKISGPLLDRLDLHIDVPAVSLRDLATEQLGEESAAIRNRVLAARRIQTQRCQESQTYCNAQLRPGQLRKYCPLNTSARALIEHAVSRWGLSARSYMRIVKISRTIADLDGRDEIGNADVAEAIQYRNLDRRHR